MKNSILKISFATLALCLIFLVSCNDGNKDEIDITPESECPALGLNVGDFCMINNLIGVVSPICECENSNSFDCPSLQLNIGDVCTTAIGTMGTVGQNCDCVQNFDCPNIQQNFGDSCISPLGVISTINFNCECVPLITYDCPVWQLNIGDSCINAAGVPIGYIDQNCDCELFPFDCPALQLNYGDSCTYNAIGAPGTVMLDCTCPPFCSVLIEEQPPNSGTFHATPLNGTPPYTYAWSTGATTSSIQVNTPGTYTVIVSDGGGCVTEKSFQL